MQGEQLTRVTEVVERPTATRRWAVVGLGSRAELYVEALTDPARPDVELVAFCDSNQTRMDVHNQWLAARGGGQPVPTYPAAEFGAMLRRERVDAVVVCTVDSTHDEYIVAALDAGCAVVTEKPMTVDAQRCQRILDAQRRTGGSVTVTFNYRYNPVHAKVRELLADGAVGTVLSVTFEWLLDVQHGADYFRRWHRDKQRSGGLLVHKSSHHFDLVNWWLGDEPETVYADGGLSFYGAANGTRHGYRREYARAAGSAEAAADPFALHLADSPRLAALYLRAEHEDGYHRDSNVFAEDITIEDDVAVVARYTRGARLSYHLVAYSPFEGYRVAFNGSAGRLELTVRENEFALPPRSGGARVGLAPGAVDRASNNRALLTHHRLWQPPAVIVDEPLGDGHGGGDQRMLDDLLGGRATAASTGPGADGLGFAADHLAGARALALGLAANTSLRTGAPVRVADVLTW
ncbi:Gfo/Idh/MocA family protein [Goodfellowiella coeruleoviolacea]|uniref:Oxidoreductase family, C-terminal alpha/beta domain n=1 Tax=Goodfellowiella coeruleoviolacea TaxID=334858 RepID=A0AAE3G9L3_9PSEU|nr:Gfo/Idh/MocA family oxidoreductase [Goodfellowiella coeruleoviolacea]MCP2164186.1 Oxidoreductase family, C-terminal alpha/beta domain [Goodfellowiella coeruleoviolacea]